MGLFGLDNAGRRKTMVESIGTTTYNYDGGGRLTSLVNPHSETTSFTYDNLNRVTRETLSPGQYSEFGYDTRNRQTSNTIKKSDGTVVSAETYTYDNAGNLTQKVIGSTTTTFTYDGADQLLTETRAGATTTYTYDANGNRTSKAAGGTTETYVVDDADKLTSITVGGSAVKTYGYDAAGRTTSVATSAGTTTLAYDYEGRISTITYPSSATNSFTYNGLDTRVGKVDSAGTTTYRRDGDDVLSPVLEAGGTKFTPGISRRTGTSSYFYHQDRMGSAIRQTNSTQGSLTSRQYDAFGNIAYVGGTWVGPFGFVGGEGYQEDADSGLQLLGQRYYESSTGRFLTRDPIKDGRNWYAYCDNNPLKWVDPAGLEESEFTRNGREWHKYIEDWYRKRYPGNKVDVEKRLANNMRPDIVDYTRGNIIEIKPNTRRKIKMAQAQIILYGDEIELDRGVIVVYPPGTRPSDFRDPISQTKWYPGHRNVPPR